MKKEVLHKGASGKSRISERAAMLSNAIKQVKSLGISVKANAPIEGKMFW